MKCRHDGRGCILAGSAARCDFGFGSSCPLTTVFYSLLSHMDESGLLLIATAGDESNAGHQKPIVTGGTSESKQRRNSLVF